MKFKRLLIFTSIIASLSSCMDHDVSKLSSEVNFEPIFALPIIHSTTTIIDLLPENENLSSDEDGYLRVVYRQENIAEVTSDSLFLIEDQTPSTQEYLIEEIELPNFSTEESVSLAEITSNLNDQNLALSINNAISSSQINGSSYFPPIESQFGGSYNIQCSDQFVYIACSDGELSFTIENNLSVELSTLELRFSNVNDNSEIALLSFQDIAPFSSVSAQIDLEQSILYSDLNFEIISLSSPGSGIDPFDQSTWVSSSLNDALSFSINGNDLLVYQGVVKFPSQSGPDTTLVVDFNADLEIELIQLSSGFLTYTFDSDVNTVLELSMTIPQLLDQNNSPFYKLIQVAPGETTFSIPLENYTIDFNGNSNQFQIEFSSEIIENQNFVDFNKLDKISYSMELENLDYDFIRGYFGQLEEVIDQDELQIDLSILSDIATGIELVSPSLSFTMNNEMGVPFVFDLDVIGYSEFEEFNLEGPSIDVPSMASSVTTFDNTNSQLSDFVSFSPDVIYYSGVVISNPEGDLGIPNTLMANSSINVSYDLDLPLHIKIKDAVRIDTLELDFDSDNLPNIDQLESVEFHLKTKNEFPIDIALSVFFEDSVSGLILDSLNFELLQAAPVDENDVVNEPIQFETKVNLTSNQFDALLNSNRALLNLRMNSYDTENTAIKLYTDYEFVIDAGVLIQTNL
ncbi:hypothetical protein N9W40_03125 [Flavobacteriales bacterium]|nr:hypothetical protein [Flavobacteriales bacterium]